MRAIDEDVLAGQRSQRLQAQHIGDLAVDLAHALHVLDAAADLVSLLLRPHLQPRQGLPAGFEGLCGALAVFRLESLQRQLCLGALQPGVVSQAGRGDAQDHRHRQAESRSLDHLAGVFGLALLRLRFACAGLGFAFLRRGLFGESGLSLGLCVAQLAQALRLGTLLTRLLGLAGADEVQVQGGGFGCVLGPCLSPGLGQSDVGAVQQAVGRATALVPLAGALQVARVLAQPFQVGVQRRHEPNQARTEARTRRPGLGVEEDVVQVGQLCRCRRVFERTAQHGNDALAQPVGLGNFPGANL